MQFIYRNTEKRLPERDGRLFFFKLILSDFIGSQFSFFEKQPLKAPLGLNP